MTRLADKKPFNRVLPAMGTMDSVYVGSHVRRQGWFSRLLCDHSVQVPYSRTDHRAGPGGYSDSYAGTCCRLCGKVMVERRTF